MTDYTPTRIAPSGYKWMKSGERYGSVVTVERINTRKWKCRCDCGAEFETYGTHLRSGVTTTCGHWRAAPDPNSYNAVHIRLSKARGAASTHVCADCGERASDWSYNRSGISELTGMRGEYRIDYSTDMEQYEPRCKRCHNHLDHEYGGQENA